MVKSSIDISQNYHYTPTEMSVESTYLFNALALTS